MILQRNGVIQENCVISTNLKNLQNYLQQWNIQLRDYIKNTAYSRDGKVPNQFHRYTKTNGIHDGVTTLSLKTLTRNSSSVL